MKREDEINALTELENTGPNVETGKQIFCRLAEEVYKVRSKYGDRKGLIIVLSTPAAHAMSGYLYTLRYGPTNFVKLSTDINSIDMVLGCTVQTAGIDWSTAYRAAVLLQGIYFNDFYFVEDDPFEVQCDTCGGTGIEKSGVCHCGESMDAGSSFAHSNHAPVEMERMCPNCEGKG